MKNMEDWLRIPGNEIWANLDVQRKLPGMNNRTFNAGPPVPGASPSGGDAVNPHNISASEPPDELPATYERAWQPAISRLREQHPGIPIMPWPTLIVTIKASGANVVRKISVPPGAQLVTFEVPNSTVAAFISTTPFTLPFAVTASDLGDDVNLTTGAMVMRMAKGVWFECASIGAFFIGLPVANDHASAAFWTGFSPKANGPADETLRAAPRL